MPLDPAQVKGKTILSAVLSVPAQGNWVTQTVTIQALSANWNVSRVNWSNQPGVTGATANSGATGALAAGERFEIDITALVQAVANGQAHYGWRLTTSQSTDISTVRGFDSGNASWVLNVETSDVLPQPTQLSPEGVIGTDLPVLSFDDVDDLSQVQVQVDPAADSVSPDYDTGWVPTSSPQVDLADLLANSLPASQGNSGTFDTDISGWIASNATLARVTTPTQAGAGALRLTATASADMFAGSLNSVGSMVPVTPGRTYHVEGYSRAATTTRSTHVQIQWYDAAGVSISTSSGTGSTNSNSAWGLREVSAVAPSNAAYLRPRGFVTAPAAGEQHYWDTFRVNAGSANYAGVADGDTTSWRVRAKTLNGSISAWSDWVEMTHEALPSIVMDNPAGTDIWDPTPTIAAHLSPAGDADTRWQVIVTEADDITNVRYDSGDAVEGAALDLTIPLRYQGQAVFPADRDYKLIVKAWDRSDRIPTAGVPSYVREVITVTLDVDGTVTAPTALALSQAASGYPDVTVYWERGSDPDYFVVRRNGVIVARVTPDDVRVAAGEFEWVDTSAEPNRTHEYTVRAVTDVAGVRKQSASSGAEDIFALVTSVWLRRDGIDIELFGDGMEAKRSDKRQSFEMPYRTENVDIVTSPGGIAGSYAGVIDRRSATIDDDVAQLNEWADAPAPTQLVWGTHNIWADIKNLSAVMSNESILPSSPIYDVTFGHEEIEPRDD